MTDDIVKHLQDAAWCKHYNDGGNNPSGKLMEEAAEEITRLREENEKLREALSEAEGHLEYAYMITFRDRLRDAAIAARSALAAIRESGE